MNDEKRNKRLRLLVGQLNKERKKQAKQIDILCNDFIAAQKDFIKSLNTVGFAADFYETTAGQRDLNELLVTAGNLLKGQIRDANIAFFLLTNNNPDCHRTSFEMHIFESDRQINMENKRIENLFTAELVDNITKSNRICTIDDMLAMGLACSPACLEKISMAAVPLSAGNCSAGFVLVYRSSQTPLTGDEIKCIAQIAPGLARSITACRALVHSV